MRIVVVCLGLFFLLSTVSTSLAISFDFTTQPPGYLYQAGSLSLQVEAFADGAPDLSKVFVTQAADGLGVSSKPGDDGQLESSGPDDFLLFEFSQAVNLRQVVFGLVDAGDKFTLDVDGFSVFGASEIWSDQTVPLTGKVSAFDFDLTGSLFSFGSDLAAEKFRIKAMTVELAPVPTPEPSTLLLLSAGVAGLLCWRRR